MTSTEYFIGLLGPVILCTILSVLIQAVTANLRSILPFAILSSPRRRESGIKASNSACLVLGGLKGPFTSIRLLWQLRELLPFLMDFLVLLSSVLTSISTSTVSLGYFGFCDTGSHDGWCYMGLGYYSLTLRVAEGILIAMAVSLIVVGVLLARLQTGVTASPWSVEHVVSLAVSIEGEGGKVRGLWDLLREMRKPRADEYIPQDAIVRHLEGYVFHLGSYEQGDGIEKYGILAYKRDKSSRLDTSGLEPTPDAPASHSGSKYKKHNRISLHTLLQEIFLLVLTALLILITYYESVEIDPQQPGPPPSTAAAFERFMDSQSISVSTLFTSLAVAISLFWDYFFSRTVLLTTAASFASTKHQPGGVSKTPPPPPVTAFDGFTSSLRRTAILLLLVSLAGILSKGIPILMAHIPFRRYQTWELHLLTGWMTVAVLAYMVLVLGGCLIGFAFFPLGLLNHPRDSTKDRKKRGLKGGLDRTCNNLPVMPDSLAGIMYMFYYYEYLVVDGIDGDTEI
ncbi:hypothetical protein V8F33_002315 [Rhypophila sp. PSN 637]